MAVAQLVRTSHILFSTRHVYKNLQLDHILHVSQTNPLFLFTTYLFTVRFNIIFLSTVSLSSSLFCWFWLPVPSPHTRRQPNGNTLQIPWTVCASRQNFTAIKMRGINPLNAELNPICHLLALWGAHHILHVSAIRVKCDLSCGIY